MGASGKAYLRRDSAEWDVSVLPVARHLLPDLETPIGVFGSHADRARIEASFDGHAQLLSFLYPFHHEA